MKIIACVIALAMVSGCGATRSYNATKASDVLLEQCRAGNTQACAIVMGGGTFGAHPTVVTQVPAQ